MNALLFSASLPLLLLLLLGALSLTRDVRREERYAERVRVIHGEMPTPKAGENAAALRAAIIATIAAVGRATLNSGLISRKAMSDLEKTLAPSGLRGPQGMAVLIGGKLLLMVVLPGLAWMVVRGADLTGMMRMMLPIAALLIGMLLPDWLIKRYRKRYLERLDVGLPDALDMMVICAQAGLGMGPAIVRVAEELQVAYREIAYEFALTASELQISSDSRAVLTSMGQRTELEGFRRLSATLIQTLQYGTPLTEALRGLSAELRQELLNKFEVKAARLPVMLTMPTILFILPCVFLIVGGPAIIRIMQTLSH